MIYRIQQGSLGLVYLELLKNLLELGSDQPIYRKGAATGPSNLTKELIGVQLVLNDCRQNVIVHPIRNLNYRFMIAEWLWIMAGRDDVGSVAYYNSQIARYSDDGMTFAGAYGPRLKHQWEYLFATLQVDPTSRQAVASIWTPDPPPSADVPCTLNLQLLLRDDSLHGIFNMRSSDAWKGIPHDAFCFSQMVNYLAGALEVKPGSLIMNLGSSHLYQQDWEAAFNVVATPADMATVRSPLADVRAWPGSVVSNQILRGKEHFSGSPFWNLYDQALHSGSSASCLKILKGEK